MVVTPLAMNHVAGVLKTLTLDFPAAPLYAGYRPTTAFNYNTPTVLGVLSLYKYPIGHQTELAFTGGTGAQPLPGETATGGSSGATAVVLGISAGWGTGGILYFVKGSNTGRFTAGETITFTNSETCVEASGILLASFTLADASPLYVQQMQRVVNTPSVGTIQGHALPPIANCVPQDQLVWKIDTQATGGTYIAGAFQLVLIMQHRGEAFALETGWNDITPVQAGISSAE
jgi:hypothetical protein